MIKRYGVYGALAVCVLLVSVFVFRGQSDDKVVKIANLPITEGLPLYIALDKGYFKEQGIAVEYVRFEAPNQIIDAVMTGKVDLVAPSGAMGISAVADSKNPGKLKIYAASGGDSIKPLNGLFVANNSNILAIEDLKGKKLGILPGIQWRTIATDILSKHNLKAVQDVTLVELAPGLHVTALSSGEVDAVLTLEPNPTIIREKGLGREITPTPTQTIANPFFAGAGIINVDFMNRYPDLAKKVLEVLDRANKDLKNSPEEARKYLKGYTALSDDLLTEVALPQIKMWYEIGEEDIAQIQKFYDIFLNHEVVSKPLEFKKLIYKE